MKPIAIIDSFVSNKTIEIKLGECIDKLKQDGFDVLLISNTKVDAHILDKLDYFLYDKRNQLFQSEYTNVRDINLYKINDTFESHDIKSGLQKHGLSVLVNMFNAINLSKSLGYTHFFRFEVDDIFGDISREFIKSVPNLCLNNNKKSLFYYNENYSNEPSNISFHFMYSEIDFFLEKVNKINNELDYRDYIFNYQGNYDFIIAEEYIYNNIKVDDDLILIKDGQSMHLDFPDTTWNTIVSDSNIDTKYNGVTTNLYKIEGDESKVILSNNYTDRICDRKIEVILNESIIDTFNHKVDYKGSWSYNITSNFDKIKVYEYGEFIYEELNQNIKNYIIFK